ncbi:MAG: DUF2586 family protein [Dysgonamonadaceae bacterium]|jgi:hypothetical protein|nr:DUF2586 family protein [Dysgonamonadaceae bacterium]
MSLRGVSIKEGAIGANVAGDSREFGLVCNGVAVANQVQLNTLITLRRPSDAAALGIDAAYDTANDVRVFRHISEFYRLAGEGRTLHLWLVAKSVMPVNMVAAAKQLVVESGGNISDIVFAFNPDSGYESTLIDGLNSDVKAAVPALQAFAAWCDEHDMPLHTVLEGRAISDTLSSLVSLRDFQVSGNVLEADKVTLVIGQDYRYAETLSALGKKFADVGTFLGNIASQAWNRNPGEVATQNLTDVKLSEWLVGGLSNHKPYSEVFGDFETLNAKGYVFPVRYQGTAGWYWNDGHTCTPVVLDAAGNINLHAIYYSHTIDMAKRALRAAYMPEVKKPVELDENGKLTTDMVDYYNAVGNNVFGELAGRGLISDGYTNTDPESDLLIEKVLNVQFAVIPTGMINEIKGTINLKNQ